MTDIKQQARKEAEALLALVKKYRPITDECPRCDGMGCSGPCPPHYWEAPMLEGFATFISERSKPSLMVGFSEEEMERVALDKYMKMNVRFAGHPDASEGKERTIYLKPVSPTPSEPDTDLVDRIMEVVKEATWINDVDLLRERLMKMAALP